MAISEIAMITTTAPDSSRPRCHRAPSSRQTGSHRKVPSIVGSREIDGRSGTSIVNMLWTFEGKEALSILTVTD